MFEPTPRGSTGRCWSRAGARSGGLMIKGVLPDEERHVTDLLDMVKLGSAQALEPAPLYARQAILRRCRRSSSGRTWPPRLVPTSATRCW